MLYRHNDQLTTMQNFMQIDFFLIICIIYDSNAIIPDWQKLLSANISD